MASTESVAAPARESTHKRARRLRWEMTHPERLLWSVLRNRGLGGLKFRRQYPIGPYIVDFYCHDLRLVVEVDGESHEGQEKKDVRRQQFLEEFGHRVFRVTNDEVLTNLEGGALGIAKAAGVMMR